MLYSKLHPDATRDRRKRQLLAVAAAWLAGGIALQSFAQAAPQPTAQDELRAAKLLEAAIFAKQSGAEDWQKLDKTYAELSAKFPGDAAIVNGHAEFLWSIGERRRAMQKWRAAESLDPKNGLVLDHLGGGYLAGGDVKTAAAFYHRAAASEPTNAAYHFDFANVAFLFRHELRNPDQPSSEDVLSDALAHFAEATRLDPLNLDYARAHAETFYAIAKPDWHAALAAWEHFAKITPNHDFALTNLARVHLNLGQKTEARACLARVQSVEFQRLKTRLSERIEAE